MSQEDLDNFCRALSLEADRGCVIVAHSFCDTALESILASHFRSHGASNDLIKFLLTKRPVPPLGSYGIRGAICRALGLISDEIYGCLQSLGEIRNATAHSPSPVSPPLEETKIAKLVRSFNESTRQALTNPMMLAHAHFIPDKQSPERTQFLMATAILYSRLMYIAETQSQDVKQGQA